MTYEQIIDSTPSEFWSWFWKPYGVAQLVSLRDRLGDDVICKLIGSEWFDSLSNADRNWFYNAFECILDEQ